VAWHDFVATCIFVACISTLFCSVASTSAAVTLQSHLTNDDYRLFWTRGRTRYHKRLTRSGQWWIKGSQLAPRIAKRCSSSSAAHRESGAPHREVLPTVKYCPGLVDVGNSDGRL
jgi:hypothetical protein